MQSNEKISSVKKFIHHFIPPDNWKFPVIILLGIFTGLGFFVLHISKATSYLSDDSKVCINCHIMRPQFATWERGSHGRVTACNDCHVPHDNIIRKYLFKAQDGMRHATMFTLRLEPQVIQIKDAGKKAVQENCIRCHQNQIHPVSLRALTAKGITDDSDIYCWHCHREVPHGKVNSLSSTPYAIVPDLSPAVPAWIQDNINKNKTSNSK
jgi:cytochrome c nitrite reductase small subunit